MSSTEEELAESWLSSLLEMFPEFDRSSVLEKKVYKLRDAQHVVDMGYEDKIPDYKTPFPGVYLCNFSQIYPMDRGVNYAVRDGYRMAELFTNQFG
jgi:protoporphyrinogen oxidase